MKHLLSVLVACLTLASGLPSQASPIPALALADLDALFSDFAVRENVPGAAWGVVVDGQLVHFGSHGRRQLSADSPIGPDTVFRIASMTKSFTAVGILQLRDAGKLSLDDPVERYLPELGELPYPTTDSPRITLRQLLTHSGGFPEDNPWGDRQLDLPEEAFSELLRRGIPFSTTPGTDYEYSNVGFALLGRVISRVSGLDYADYVEQHILMPLGMRSTTLEPASVPAGQRTEGYRFEDGTHSLEAQPAHGAFGAMGGMLSSVEDLARYVGMFTAAYPARDGEDTLPLSRASLREMQQIWRARPAKVTLGVDGKTSLFSGGYGYGLRSWQDCRFEHIAGHTGGLPGFGSQMRWLPEYGIGLVAMGNRTYLSWSTVFDQAFAQLDEAGLLHRRLPRPAPALIQARKDVETLFESWDDALVQRISADNLLPDRSLDTRRQEFREAAELAGACTPRQEFSRLPNALRGEWVLDCERADLLFSLTLAPTQPPLIQHLDVRALENESSLVMETCP